MRPLQLTTLLSVANALTLPRALPSNRTLPSTQDDATPSYWLDQMDHTGSARGFAPFADDSMDYPVWRNVRDPLYGAAGDGSVDDSGAIQYAIDHDKRVSESPLSTRPAVVYLPGGTYRLDKGLDLKLNTFIIGDPTNPPVLKAASTFSGGQMLSAHHAADTETLNFFMSIKNVVFDTTGFDKDSSMLAMDWSVSQACQLTNVNITMPYNSGGHTGIGMYGGSATLLADVAITGGNVGIEFSNQQINLKGVLFHGCTTALKLSFAFEAIVQKASFDSCGTCIDVGSGVGSAVVLDCDVSNSGPVVKFYDSSKDGGKRNNQLVIDHLHHDGSGPVAVTTNSGTVLSDFSNVDTWLWGNEDPGSFETGKRITTERSQSLLDGNGNFFTTPQPTYVDTSAEDVVNVKAFGNFTVKGDGQTDDSAALNSIFSEAVGNIVYIPYGVYILRSTLHIPAGTRMVGECWSTFSGVGDAFSDAENPAPVVSVGKAGDVGVAQIQDMRFTVADVSPGAVILEVNMKGRNQGDVGFWNTHVTVGGFADSKVNNACGDADTSDCKTAFAMVHLTESSGAYIENMWGWTADHSIDGGPSQNIATGRGLLVESTQGTWLTGTAFEHNTLYNYNLHSACNVYAGMQQSETPYWQGSGSSQDAPDPWTPDSRFGDPDFSWCDDGDQQCRMTLAQNIDGGSNLFLYGAGFWTFFNAMNLIDDSDVGITNEARVTGDPENLYWYSVNTRSADVMVLDGNDPKQYNHPGGWGGIIAAYLPFAGGNDTRRIKQRATSHPSLPVRGDERRSRASAFYPLGNLTVHARDAGPTSVPSPVGQTFTDDITYYAPGLGSCGWTNTENDYIVAMAENLMLPGDGDSPNNNPLCGRKIMIQYNGNTAEATIADTCPGCDGQS